MTHLRITSPTKYPADVLLESCWRCSVIDVHSSIGLPSSDRVISATIELATSLDIDVHANVDAETRATATMSVFGEPFTLDGICKLVTHLLSGLDADTLNDLLAEYRAAT